MWWISKEMWKISGFWFVELHLEKMSVREGLKADIKVGMDYKRLLVALKWLKPFKCFLLDFWKKLKILELKNDS